MSVLKSLLKAPCTQYSLSTLASGNIKSSSPVWALGTLAYKSPELFFPWKLFFAWFHEVSPYLWHSAILNTYWYSAKGSKWPLCRFHKHFCLWLHCFWYSPLKFLAPSALPMYSLHFLNSERVQGFIWVLPFCILIQKLPLGKKLGLTSVFFSFIYQGPQSSVAYGPMSKSSCLHILSSFLVIYGGRWVWILLVSHDQE